MTYHATTTTITIKIFTNFFKKKQSLMLSMAATNYRVFTIGSHRFDKKMSYQEPFYTNWAKGKVITKNGQTMFELVRRIQNIDVFKKNLIRAATDLIESRLFRRQGIAILEDKIGHFQRLDLHHELMDNSNFRSFSMRPQKRRSNPTYPLASGCVDPKIKQGRGMILQQFLFREETFFSKKKKFQPFLLIRLP